MKATGTDSQGHEANDTDSKGQSVKRVAAILALLVLGAIAAYGQGTSTTSTQIAPQGPAFAVFYYKPADSIVWEAQVTCNEYSHQLYVTFIQTNGDPYMNLTFQNACSVTGSGYGPYNVTVKTPLSFLDSDNELDVITSLNWTTTSVLVNRVRRWQSGSSNGMSILYRDQWNAQQ